MSGQPQRIQLSRRKGWRLPPNTVVVSRPSKWGNPWTYDEATAVVPELGFRLFTRDPKRRRDVRKMLVAEFRRWLLDPVASCERHQRLDGQRRELLARLSALRGKNLACWCPLPKPGEPDVCHAAVLLEIANAPASLGDAVISSLKQFVEEEEAKR